MPFTITCEGPEIPPAAAAGASDALYFALDLVDLGYADVRVRTPTGETYSVEAFAALIRDEAADEQRRVRRA